MTHVRQWMAMLGTTLSIGSVGPAIAAQPGVPALQITAPNGATSTLVAGMQRPVAGLSLPAPSIVQGKTRLVLTLDSESEEHPFEPGPAFVDPAAAAETGRTGGIGRAPWANKLTDAQIDQLRTRTRCFLKQSSEALGQPEDPAQDASDAEYWVRLAVGGRDPYFALALASSPCVPSGTRSREFVLRQAAIAAKVPVVALDSTDQVYARYWSAPIALLAQLLYDHALTPHAARDLERIVAALNQGDFASLGQAFRPGGIPEPEQKRLDRLLVFDAVDAMLPKLKPLLDEGNALVVFDASKLGGQYGLLPALEQAGYRLQPITLPAAPSINAK
ncbi:TraB/GumN family protein [Pseudomonadota bacterium AL_CKDN230030165-1A_HGKHYDSX7]